jgi:hypothetical protein
MRGVAGGFGFHGNPVPLAVLFYERLTVAEFATRQEQRKGQRNRKYANAFLGEACTAEAELRQLFASAGEPKLAVAHPITHPIRSANPLKMVAAADACAHSQIEVFVPQGRCGEAASLSFCRTNIRDGVAQGPGRAGN